MVRSRKTITVFGVLLCVAAVLAGRQIGRRMQNKLDVLDREVETRQREINQANREFQAKTHYVKKWDRVQGLLQKTVQERQLEFDPHLIKLAEDSGVVIREKGYTDAPMENHLEFNILNCNLKLDCKIGELADFVAMLDREKDWLLRIENLIVKTAERSTFGASTYSTDLPSTKDIQVEMVASMPAASAKKESVEPKAISKKTL